MDLMTITDLSTALSFILIIGGLIAIVLPFAPSVPTIWFGIFLYGVSHDYVSVNQNFMILVSVIAMLTIVLDYTLSRTGVQRMKAGPGGVVGAVLGGLVGTIFGPIATYLIGPVLGAIIIELLRGRDRVFSFQSGKYTIVAFMGGTVVKLVAAVVMIGLFILRLQGRI